MKTPSIDVSVNLDAATRRHVALDLACRIVSPGTSTREVLSRSREIEAWLATGIVVAPDGKAAADFNVGSFHVSIDGRSGTLTPGVVEAIRAALGDVL